MSLKAQALINFHARDVFFRHQAACNDSLKKRGHDPVAFVNVCPQFQLFLTYASASSLCSSTEMAQLSTAKEVFKNANSRYYRLGLFGVNRYLSALQIQYRWRRYIRRLLSERTQQVKQLHKQDQQAERILQNRLSRKLQNADIIQNLPASAVSNWYR